MNFKISCILTLKILYGKFFKDRSSRTWEEDVNGRRTTSYDKGRQQMEIGHRPKMNYKIKIFDKNHTYYTKLVSNSFSTTRNVSNVVLTWNDDILNLRFSLKYASKRKFYGASRYFVSHVYEKYSQLFLKSSQKTLRLECGGGQGISIKPWSPQLI